MSARLVGGMMHWECYWQRAIFRAERRAAARTIVEARTFLLFAELAGLSKPT